MRERLIESVKNSLNKHIGKSCLLAENIADDLLENGVIVPPCKVGTTIYMIVTKRAKVTREYFYFIKKTKLTFLNLERVLENWGKTVFLTREEAISKLQASCKQVKEGAE